MDNTINGSTILYDFAGGLADGLARAGAGETDTDWYEIGDLNDPWDPCS